MVYLLDAEVERRFADASILRYISLESNDAFASDRVCTYTTRAANHSNCRGRDLEAAVGAATFVRRDRFADLLDFGDGVGEDLGDQQGRDQGNHLDRQHLGRASVQW